MPRLAQHRRAIATVLRRLSGGLGLCLVGLVLLAYVALALAPFRWVPPRRAMNGATAGAAGLTFAAPGIARTHEPPRWLGRAAEVGSVQLDLRLRTHAPTQRKTRIFTVSRDYHYRNLSLDQEGPDLILRLRRPGSTPNGKPAYRLAGVLGDTTWHAIEITIAPGRLRVLVDGALALAGALPERPLGEWDRRYLVALGNELHGNLPWRGEVARALVQVGDEQVDYARPGVLDVPAEFWAFANKPTWLFENFVFPASLDDWVANFVAFIPLGFLLATPRRGRDAWRRAVLLCAATSLTVEIAQGFFSRHPSTMDLVLNTLGGAVGAAIACRLAALVLPTGSDDGTVSAPPRSQGA